MEIASFASAIAHVRPGTFVPDIGDDDQAPKVTPLDGAAAVAGVPDQTTSFADTLKGFLGGVSDKINVSDQNTRDLASGRTNDLGKVVTSVEEANLGLELTTSMQNKLLQAYQQISTMQV